MIFWRDWLRKGTRFVLEAPARVLARWGVSPAVLTLCGLTASLGAGLLFALGDLVGAAWMLLVAGFFDMTDGQVARLRGVASDRGAYLDSFTDRWADGGALGGVIYLLARQGAWLWLACAVVALAGSLTVSYAKARAENFIPDCKVGFWERPERMVLVVLGGFVGLWALEWCMAILAAGTLVTSVHRAVHTLRRIPPRIVPTQGGKP